MDLITTRTLSLARSLPFRHSRSLLLTLQEGTSSRSTGLFKAQPRQLSPRYRTSTSLNKPKLSTKSTPPGPSRTYAVSAAVLLAGAALVSLGSSQDAHAEAPPAKSSKKLRLAEIRKHDSSAEHPWVIRGNRVYDITDWVPAHPGGDVILRAAGGTIDQYWEIFTIHDKPYVREILEELFIGTVDPRDLVDGKIPQDNIADPFESDPKRDERLKVHSAKPCNAETQSESLLPYITPNEVFYVRNHLWVPDLKDEKGFTITIEREDGEEVAYTLDDLKSKFKEHTITATLQCSGNRRAHMSETKPAQGLPWGIGAIGNAQWSGVLLRDVLKDAGLNLADLPEDVKHVQFRGVEAYGASIPIDKAIDKIGDVLMAFSMNGKPLPPDHGYPCRIIVPGHVAARSVKWVNRITLSDEESPANWQRRDYKCFGPNVGPNEADWDDAPAIQETPVQSAITRIHKHSRNEKQGATPMISLEGYAFAGGGRRIVRVDVSADDGKTWHQADLVKPDQDEKAAGHKAWGWQQWKYDTSIDQAGKNFLVKATDEGYNTQPADHESSWNFRGNLATAWHRLSVPSSTA